MPEIITRNAGGWQSVIALLLLEGARYARESTRTDLRGEQCAQTCALEVASLVGNAPWQPCADNQAVAGQLSLCEARLAQKSEEKDVEKASSEAWYSEVPLTAPVIIGGWLHLLGVAVSFCCRRRDAAPAGGGARDRDPRVAPQRRGGGLVVRGRGGE